MNSLVHSEEQLAGLIVNIPFRAGSLCKLMACAGQDRVGLAKIARLIKSDPCLCINVLRLANEFGRDLCVDTIEKSIETVGSGELLRGLIGLSHCEIGLANELFVSDELRSYFLHSVRISRASAALGRAGGMDADEILRLETAGLIHDIGRFIILMSINQVFSDIAWGSSARMATIVDEARASAGMDHCRLGGLFCESWNLPVSLVESVKYHHCPIREGIFSRTAGVVFAGHFVAAESRRLSEEILSCGLLDRLDMSFDDFRLAREIFQGEAS